MTRLPLVLFLLFPVVSFGQVLNDTLLSSFYDKTLALYFTDSIENNDQKKFGKLLIKTDFNNSLLSDHTGRNKFLFFNEQSDIYSFMVRPFKKNKNRKIYWIKHESIASDTVDICVGGWTVRGLTKKNISLGAWCGGTMGYIPDARFVYSKEANTWMFISKEEIMTKKTDEIMRRFKKTN